MLILYLVSCDVLKNKLRINVSHLLNTKQRIIPQKLFTKSKNYIKHTKTVANIVLILKLTGSFSGILWYAIETNKMQGRNTYSDTNAMDVRL